MSIYKKVFGIFLIFFSLFLIIAIGLPQLYTSKAIGRIDKEVAVNISFLEDFDSPIVLFYFGYVGCETICTPAMNEITQMYEEVDQTKVKVYFINLLPNNDSQTTQNYAKYFHQKFDGIYLNEEDVQKIRRQLNINTTNSLIDSTEINHTGFLYLLVQNTDKKYKQKYIYTTRPFNKKLIIEDISTLLQ